LNEKDLRRKKQWIFWACLKVGASKVPRKQAIYFTNTPRTMKTNPEGWTIPAEFPPAFALPEQFRQPLPAEVQQWLDSVEKRIDGLTLDRIEQEAGQLAGDDNPAAEKFYRLGRRRLYTRMQQIVDIMFSGKGVEVGIDLLRVQVTNELPGGAVSDALMDGENINRSGANSEHDPAAAPSSFLCFRCERS
jgi:hypothetical protein